MSTMVCGCALWWKNTTPLDDIAYPHTVARTADALKKFVWVFGVLQHVLYWSPGLVSPNWIFLVP